MDRYQKLKEAGYVGIIPGQGKKDGEASIGLIHAPKLKLC